MQSDYLQCTSVMTNIISLSNKVSDNPSNMLMAHNMNGKKERWQHTIYSPLSPLLPLVMVEVNHR